jgi:hypothetical protein
MALPVPQTHVFAAVCHGVQPGITLACAKPTDMASAIRATAEVFSMLVPPDVVMALEIPEAAWLGYVASRTPSDPIAGVAATARVLTPFQRGLSPSPPLTSRAGAASTLSRSFPVCFHHQSVESFPFSLGCRRNISVSATGSLATTRARVA